MSQVVEALRGLLRAYPIPSTLGPLFEWTVPPIKSLNEVLREYENNLTRFSFDVLNEQLGKVDFRRAHKELIRQLAARAFGEGWQEGGGDLSDIGSKELDSIQDWIDGQVEHVNDFAAWLVSTDADGKINTEAKRRELDDRIDLWVASLRGLGQLGEAKAQGDPIIYLDGDDGVESCEECQEFKGRENAHRLSWWEKRGLLTRNGNANYGCGRWENCHHSFYNRVGELVIA